MNPEDSFVQLQWDPISETLINPNNTSFMSYFSQINYSPASMDSGFNTDVSNNMSSPTYANDQHFPSTYSNFQTPPPPPYQMQTSFHEQNYSSPAPSSSSSVTTIQNQSDWIYNNNNNMDHLQQSLSTETPYLEVKEQPNEHFRFRYITEMQGPHGTIKGNSTKNGNKNLKCFPTVILHNYKSPGEVVIRCSLYQKAEECENVLDRKIHPHKLVMRPCDLENHDPHYVKVSKQNNFTAVFQGLGIIQTKRVDVAEVLAQKIKKEREYEANRILDQQELELIRSEAKTCAKKKIEISQISLGFTAFIKNSETNEWIKITETVYSNTINNDKSTNGKLSISRMSTCTSPAQGGTEVFMFVSKVDKNSIAVRFYETDDGEPHGTVVWEGKGKFSPSDVHHQFGIVLTTPPYGNQYIDEDVKVFIQLYRKDAPNKTSVSEPLDFTYKPNRRRKIPRPNTFAPIPKTVESFGEPKNFPSNHPSTSCSSSHEGSGNMDFNQGNVQRQEQGEDFDIVNMILTIRAEGYETTSPNISMIEQYLRGDSEILQLDAAVPKQSETKMSLLEKLKSIERIFKNSCDIAKIRDVMMIVIDSLDESAFTDVIQYGSIEDIQEISLLIVRYSLNHVLQFKNDVDQNVLHLCIINGYQNALKVFIKLGADVNQSDVFGQTPLQIAVQENLFDCVKTLLSTSATNSVNQFDDKGHTPLSLSVSNSNVSMTKLLMNYKAIPSLKNPTNGFNSLHVAVNVQQPNMEMIRYLIEVDQKMLFAETHTGKNVLNLALANKLPDKIIEHLTMFYVDEEELDFDAKCMTKLCEVFDKNHNWKMWVTLMDIEDKIGEWELLESPSQALFSFLKTSKKSLEDLVGLLDVLNDQDRSAAMNAIDEMMARKFERVVRM